VPALDVRALAKAIALYSWFVRWGCICLRGQDLGGWVLTKILAERGWWIRCGCAHAPFGLLNQDVPKYVGALGGWVLNKTLAPCGSRAR
jgi:hypothetical protein